MTTNSLVSSQFDCPNAWIAYQANPYFQANVITQHVFHKLRTLFPAIAQKIILNWGCGLGGYAHLFAQMGARGVVAVDQAQTIIHEARRLHPQARVDFLISDNAKIFDFGESNWHFIFSHCALQFRKDLPLFFQKAATSLRLGGHLLFTIEHPLFTHGKDDPALYWQRGRRTRTFGTNSYQEYHRMVATYLTALGQTGLQIDRCLEISAEPTHCPPLLAVRAKKVQ